MAPKHTLNGRESVVSQKNEPAVHANLRVDQNINGFLVDQVHGHFLRWRQMQKCIRTGLDQLRHGIGGRRREKMSRCKDHDFKTRFLVSTDNIVHSCRYEYCPHSYRSSDAIVL